MKKMSKITNDVMFPSIRKEAKKSAVEVYNEISAIRDYLNGKTDVMPIIRQVDVKTHEEKYKEILQLRYFFKGKISRKRIADAMEISVYEVTRIEKIGNHDPSLLLRIRPNTVKIG